jgi:acetylglutamate kinase
VKDLVIVKVGGRAQQDAGLARAVATAWAAHPRALVVVHGGGDEASRLQRALLGTEPVFVRGRRVTSAEDIDLLRMALSGVANKRLVAALAAAGVPAIGLSGEDGRLLRAAAGDAALGHVGSVERVNVALLAQLLVGGWMPVVSPLSADGASAGEALNVNGDDAAAAIAAACGAEELLLVTDVPAVLARTADGALAPIGRLTAAEARTLLASGVAAGGMAAKVEAALAALAAGVRRVRIGDVGAIADAGSGTVFVATGTAPHEVNDLPAARFADAVPAVGADFADRRIHG